MSRPFLSVENLVVHFPTPDGIVQATNGLSYTLERGKTLGIVGESGSGKSVSSSAILGLHRGTSAQVGGQIWLDGVDLFSLSDEEMRRRRGHDIAMIFQDPLSALHPYYRVGDQIAEAYRAHHNVPKRVARTRTIEMLARVGIPQPDRRVDDYPHQFSGGMRQRVMIAMALINDPTLQRDLTVECPACRPGADGKRHGAVFFQATSAATSDERLAMIFVCCNPECLHKWQA